MLAGQLYDYGDKRSFGWMALC